MDLTISYEQVDAVCSASIALGLLACAGSLAAIFLGRSRGRTAALGITLGLLACVSLVLAVHAQTCYAVPETARLDVVSTCELEPCGEASDGSDLYAILKRETLSVLTEDGPRTYGSENAALMEDDSERPRVDMVESYSEAHGRFLIFDVVGKVGVTDPVPYIYVPAGTVLRG